jgi:hypothetical protein
MRLQTTYKLQSLLQVAMSKLQLEATDVAQGEGVQLTKTALTVPVPVDSGSLITDSETQITTSNGHLKAERIRH